jgi:hypothetical protein
LAALTQFKKLQDQLSQAKERLATTQRDKQETKHEVSEVKRRTEKIQEKAAEARRQIFSQQQELRTLRQRLREAKDPAVAAQKAKADAAAAASARNLNMDKPMPAPNRIEAFTGGVQEEGRATGNETLESTDANNDRPLTGDSEVAPLYVLKKEDGAGPHQNSLTSLAAAGSLAGSRRSIQSAPSGDLKTSSSNVSLQEELINDMQLVRQVCSAPTTLEGGLGFGSYLSAGGDSWLPEGCEITEADEDDEAEIYLLKQPNNVTLAKLRHPSGAEALLDLSTAFVLAWRLPDGRAAAGANTMLLSALQPVQPRADVGITASILAENDPDHNSSALAEVRHASTEPNDAPWRLMQLDDSNNEPSALLMQSSSDEQGASWRCKRSYTLGPNWLREDVLVENMAKATSITIGEEVPDETAVNRAAAVMKPSLLIATPASVTLRTDRSVNEETDTEAEGEVTTVPPLGFWVKRRWWVAEATTG